MHSKEKTEINEAEFKSQKRLEMLKKKRGALADRLKEARSNYLSARARRNYVESRINAIDEEIYKIEQGQLCLGDCAEASA